MRIIGLGHEKFVGKDTVANLLLTILRLKGVDAEKISFARKLKDISHEMFSYLGLQDSTTYDDQPELKNIPLPCGITPRDIWLKVGNDFRAIDKDVWCNYVIEYARGSHLIIPDIRYYNEVEFLRSKGDCTFIKVVRPEIKHTSDVADDDLLDFTGWDKILMNDSDLNALNKKVQAIAEELV